MPLKLKLAAHEQLVVNGAVMMNGGYRATLVIRNYAHIMREKDVLQEQDADTPTKRLYFQVQVMLMQPPPPPELLASFRENMALLRTAYENPEQIAALDQADALVEAGDYYKALMKLQPVIRYEADLLDMPAHEWRRSTHKSISRPVSQSGATT
jgi:flagellar biosynthesis repressor protein FlbT